MSPEASSTKTQDATIPKVKRKHKRGKKKRRKKKNGFRRSQMKTMGDYKIYHDLSDEGSFVHADDIIVENNDQIRHFDRKKYKHREDVIGWGN